jgi:hypothetical protein
MARLINSESKVTRQWNPITLKTSEDVGDVIRDVGSY